MTDTKRAFVFVHGGWHNAATWRLVIPLLEARGRVARALDLPGAGAHARMPSVYGARPLDAAAFAAAASPNSHVTQADRTRAVVSLVEETARESGGPVVLVGHSLGGRTITAVAEAIPDRLIALVYVAAFLLPSDMSVLSMLLHETMAEEAVRPLFLADPQAVGALRIDPRSDDSGYRGQLKNAFYNDMADEDFARALAELHCDEPAGVVMESVAITSGRFGRVPRHYVRCLEDRAIPLSGQDFMIAAVDAALGGPTRTYTLAAGHSPFYSRPRELADILLSIGSPEFE